jgi:hypothetical protein
MEGWEQSHVFRSQCALIFFFFFHFVDRFLSLRDQEWQQEEPVKVKCLRMNFKLTNVKSKFMLSASTHSGETMRASMSADQRSRTSMFVSAEDVSDDDEAEVETREQSHLYAHKSSRGQGSRKFELRIGDEIVLQASSFEGR